MQLNLNVRAITNQAIFFIFSPYYRPDQPQIFTKIQSRGVVLIFLTISPMKFLMNLSQSCVSYVSINLGRRNISMT